MGRSLQDVLPWSDGEMEGRKWGLCRSLGSWGLALRFRACACQANLKRCVFNTVIIRDGVWTIPCLFKMCAVKTLGKLWSPLWPLFREDLLRDGL